jgi:hypothetical protein
MRKRFDDGPDLPGRPQEAAFPLLTEIRGREYPFLTKGGIDSERDEDKVVERR